MTKIELLEENEKLSHDNNVYHEKCSELYSELIDSSIKINNLEKSLKKKKIKNEKYKIKNNIKRLDKDVIINKLLKYDVISFDIFDTLVLRNVSNPVDIFKIVGYKIGIENFFTYRIKAEEEARNITNKKNKEINIYDIYDVLKTYINIDVDKVIEQEINTELDFVMANPYFKDIYNILLQNNKQIIIISDMYLPKKYMSKILSKCGYENYNDLFISCEYEENKGSSQLQKIAKDKIGDNLKYIHIGDNYVSDILGSKKVGFDTYYYEKYNSYDVYNNSISSSINEAICNNYFNNGLNRETPYFEYGFKYAGLMVCGFCEYLNSFAKDKFIDKILFLARDMDIVYKVYNKFYNNVASEYLIISRTASLELNFDDLTLEFIEFYFKTRIGLKEKLKNILEDSDLSILIPKLESSNLKGDDILSSDNYYLIKDFIYKNKKIISTYFKPSKKAFKEYISKLIKKSKNISIVDLGWSGQILIQLKHFIQNNIDSNINIYGNYMANTTNDKVNGYIESGLMDSYLFNYSKNENYILNTATIKDNTKAMILEAIFSSVEPTLLKYDYKETYEFIYGEKTSDEFVVSQIQKGIMEFASIYTSLTKNYNFKISPTDAYKPFNLISDNFLYNYNIFKNTKEYSDSIPRFKGNRKITTIGKIIKKRDLI
jgi:HAD superfamily hydrolase (TIGR01549 family)